MLDRHRENHRLEPGSLTGRAGHLAHVPLVLLPREIRVRLRRTTFQERDDTLELRVVRALPVEAVSVGDVYLLVGSVQHRFAHGRRQLIPWCVHGEAHRGGKPLEQPVEVLAGGARRPRVDRAGAQGRRTVGDDELRVDLFLGAQAGALRTGAERGVEGERPRLQLVEGERVVVRAGEPFGVAALPQRIVFVEVDEVEDDDAVGQPETGFHRIGDALFGRLPVDQAVDDHLDRMLLLLLQLRCLGQRVDHAVDPHPGIALRLQVRQQVDVLSLALPDHRREHLEAGAFRHLQHPVDHLLWRLLRDRLATDRAMRVADPGEQQPEIVVDLGDGADGGSRVPGGGFLVDRDRRRQSLDEVDVRLVHLAEELPGVGGQGLDIAPLPLGEDGVKGERRLPRTRQTGENHQRITRQGDVDVPQVVLAGSAHDQVVSHGTHAMCGVRQPPISR